MLKKTVMAVLILTSSLCAQQMLTLEDAIELGLRNNYDIQIARNQAKASNNNRGRGLAGLLPTLDVSARYSRTDSDQETNLPPLSTTSDVDNFNTEVALNWTLFDGFRMFIDRRKFNDLALLGNYEAKNRIEGSVVAISIAYFNLVRQEQLLQVARETRDISETRLGRERVRKQLGGSSSTDFLNAQVAFNSDQSALLNQKLQVTIARQQLNVLLGQDPDMEFSVSNKIDVPELTLSDSEVLNMALERNSGLKTAEFDRKIADGDVRSAHSAFLPRLNAFANYGYIDRTINSDAGQYPGRDVGTQTTDGTVGLAVSFNLFNGRRDKIELQNARIEADSRALALRDARNRLIGTVKETLETYRERMDMIALEEENILAARQNLDLQRERHQLGAAGSLVFRDAQASYSLAQVSLITARYQARISHLELERLIGELKVD
jgi:outer membrane protein TolC